MFKMCPSFLLYKLLKSNVKKEPPKNFFFMKILCTPYCMGEDLPKHHENCLVCFIVKPFPTKYMIKFLVFHFFFCF